MSKQRALFVLWSALVALLVLSTAVGAAGASSVSVRQAMCDQVFGFESQDFTNPISIDNKWLPLIPGTQFVLEGRINQGGGSVAVPHQVIFTVTDLTKVINGVRTRVMWDQDINDGEVVEAELAFFAQDDGGKVWNLGEYPEEYEGGVFIGAPSTWIAGLAGAKAGVHMFSNPQVGTPSYLQGLALNIKFLDCGQVADMGQNVSVPAGNYKDVLVINEWSPLEPDSGIQIKYHAPGVGIVQVGALGDPEAETLVLTKLRHLGPRALAEAREEALKLDRHGYQVSNVYRMTPPAE